MRLVQAIRGPADLLWVDLDHRSKATSTPPPSKSRGPTLGQSISATHIATATGVSEETIVGMMRAVTPCGPFREPAVETYTHPPDSEMALLVPPMRAVLGFMGAVPFRIWTKLSHEPLNLLRNLCPHHQRQDSLIGLRSNPSTLRASMRKPDDVREYLAEPRATIPAERCHGRDLGRGYALYLCSEQYEAVIDWIDSRGVPAFSSPDSVSSRCFPLLTLIQHHILHLVDRLDIQFPTPMPSLGDWEDAFTKAKAPLAHMTDAAKKNITYGSSSTTNACWSKTPTTPPPPSPTLPSPSSTTTRVAAPQNTMDELSWSMWSISSGVRVWLDVRGVEIQYEDLGVERVENASTSCLAPDVQDGLEEGGLAARWDAVMRVRCMVKNTEEVAAKEVVQLSGRVSF
ncbi:uncharacterized protein BP01DRAFT_369217 [Aspergillus saccharolyticus JOP 1030-1]|uniref:Uncharacterized protein n=1 Tax=Aspergillus saccharolyticus JOP 1030-1 TaxID=1450539 RepID=A0A319A1G3_9EURO|nr:hypothetical protein BP01DRAFT_369217 [Aspergillus saccharolyticus JOP 1030-1]PYH41332.1 hypothetical protein BP01DRAFT_369217 [Aspergillus saccharolyticus JOP 1030-1]